MYNANTLFSQLLPLHSSLALMLVLLLLAGCSSIESEPPINPTEHTVTCKELTTTTHTDDGKNHLTLRINTAVCDSQHQTLYGHGVCAILTHRNTHTISIHTPTAIWDEYRSQLSTTGTTVVTHPYGTLQADGGTNLRLDQHHLFFKGPLTHTLYS